MEDIARSTKLHILEEDISDSGINGHGNGNENENGNEAQPFDGFEDQHVLQDSNYVQTCLQENKTAVLSVEYSGSKTHRVWSLTFVIVFIYFYSLMVYVSHRKYGCQDLSRWKARALVMKRRKTSLRRLPPCNPPPLSLLPVLTEQNKHELV